MSTKKMSNFDFSAITERLMAALNLRREYELAYLLGFKKDSFSARKLRNAVPVDKIRLLCKEKSLNENWILYGEGEMFAVNDAPTPYTPELPPEVQEMIDWYMKFTPEERARMIKEDKERRLKEWLEGKK